MMVEKVKCHLGKYGLVAKLSESLKGGSKIGRGAERERKNVGIPEGKGKGLINQELFSICGETGGTSSCGWLDEGCMQLCEETGRGDGKVSE